MKARIIKTSLALLTAVILLQGIVQGMTAYKLWHNSTQISSNDKRVQVLSQLSTPTQAWAKADSMDIWVQRILLGGVKIQVQYKEDSCDRENKTQPATQCQVAQIHRSYYTLWGNPWFLGYSKHITPHHPHLL